MNVLAINLPKTANVPRAFFLRGAAQVLSYPGTQIAEFINPKGVAAKFHHEN
jgi:hypothetical protein